MSQKVNSPEFIGIRCTGYTHLVVLLKTFSVNLPVYQLIPEIFPKGAGGGGPTYYDTMESELAVLHPTT